ncbi:MAG: DUF222 domain-containing protein [Ilumatobacteraceae bacterium]
MFQVRVVDDVRHLVSSDPAACDSSELAVLVAVTQRVRGWLDSYDTRIALRAAELAKAGVGAAASDVLAGGGRRSTRDANAAARRAGVCDQLPQVHDALAAGELSAGHVDSIARTAAALDDAGRSQLAELQPAIVAAAASSSVEDFAKDMGHLQQLLSADDGLSEQARNRRNRKVRRWVDQATGVCHTHLELDAETDAKVAAALDAAVAAARAKPQDPDLTFDQLQADALVGLITRPPDAAVGGNTGRRVPEVTVLIDLQTLQHGLHSRGVCETGGGNQIPAASGRRMCCDAAIIPIVLDGAGVVSDVGRANRLATAEQRRALRAMHSTCAHPRCRVRFEDCRIHHVIPWEQGGLTDLANLLPLCSLHHHLVHEGGWTLTLRPDRTITLCRPDGTVHYDGPSVSRTGPHGVAPEPPPTAEPAEPEQPDEPDDRFPHIPAHLKRAAARARAERAANPPPPPARPWRPDPACTEIPEHLIRAALRLQGATSADDRNQAQRREIGHAASRRFALLETGESTDPAGEPSTEMPVAESAPIASTGTQQWTRPPPRAPAA